MKVAAVDRRVARRRYFKAPLRVRIWRSAISEQRAESENLSEKGICSQRIPSSVWVRQLRSA